MAAPRHLTAEVVLLKQVFVNGRKIPIPVPVYSLDDVLDWLQETLIPEGHTVTRIAIDGDPLDVSDPANFDFSAQLRDNTKVELQVDSPADLAVQTLEAIRNLSSVITSGIKPLAVDCWQAKPVDKPEEIEDVGCDIELIQELLDHLAGLIPTEIVETAAIQGIGGLLKRTSLGLTMAISNSDWKASARILLNKIEPLLKDLVTETETLQVQILACNETNHIAKADAG